MTRNLFVSTIALNLAKKLKSDLIEQGFTLSTPPYTLFSGKKPGVSCTLYTSGKLVVQGGEITPFMEFYLEPEILQEFSFTYGTQLGLAENTAKTEKKTAHPPGNVQGKVQHGLTPHIGVDESGKGDFFGPLCIAAVYADADGIEWLARQGVRDSKELSPAFIAGMAPKIRDRLPHHIIAIGPAKYNELYDKFGNLNSLLAWGHATAIEQLVEKTGCKDILIDQFAHESVVVKALKKKGVDVALQQRHRGEEDPVVAAASLLARTAFVDGMAVLSKRFGIALPKGAAPVVIRVGKQFVMEHSRDELKEVAKLHFKTTAAVTDGR